jgi:hypothetical protein
MDSAQKVFLSAQITCKSSILRPSGQRRRAFARREPSFARRSPQAVHTWRWVAFAAIMMAFFLIALNGDIYNLTSPPQLSFHVLLRKSYSIVAFAVIGAAFVWASGKSVLYSALVVALYSAAIEIGQHFTYGREPFAWNVIDVACGAIGGALGALIPGVRAR